MALPRRVIPVLGIMLAAAVPAAAQTPSPSPSPSQLDRIEQKLDIILHRLDQLQPGEATQTGPASLPSGAGQAAATAPAAGSAATAPPPDPLAGGALAVFHPAPATALAAHAIPADSVGGFVYTGGSIQLDSLKDRGIRYTGLAGVEWQGWLRTREVGRYEFDLDGSLGNAQGFASAACTFEGWLEDRPIGVQDVSPNSGLARLALFSLVLGAELTPGLYKLRLWAACTPSMRDRDQSLSVQLLEKAPADLNFRPVTAADLAHKQANDHPPGSPG
jgi:hypothetical protein